MKIWEQIANIGFVTSEVTQVCVIGPLHLPIYINDLPNSLKSGVRILQTDRPKKVQ